VYDQYGEDGLKNGIPSDNPTSQNHSGHSGGWHFSSDPNEIFSKMFGNSKSSSMFGFDRFGDDSEMGFPEMGFTGMGRRSRGPKQSPPVMVIAMFCVMYTSACMCD
jgi:DnaJ-class molecular chaperone